MKVRAALLLAVLALLAGCGLRPLYGGATGTATLTTLSAVEVAPIEGKSGWLMTSALRERLNRGKDATPRYRLVVALDDQIEGFGVRTDDAVTRERRSLRARYQLIDLDMGTVLLDASAGSDAGIDIVSSEYATIAAEDTALENLTIAVADQIVSRLALYASRTRARESE